MCPSNTHVIKKSKAYPVHKFINTSLRETYFRGNFYTNNNLKYVDIFENQDSSLMKNLSLANCLVKIPAKKTILKSDFLEILELKSGF